MSRWVFIILVLLMSSFANAQSRLDSLTTYAASEENDTLRFAAYMEIAMIYYNQTDFDAGIDFLHQCEEEIRQIKRDTTSPLYQRTKFYLGKFFYYESFMYYRMSQYENALAPLDSARLAYENASDRKNLVQTYKLRGAIFQYQSKYDSALVYYQKAGEIAAEIPDSLGMANTINNRADIFKINQEYDRAIEMYSEVQRLGEGMKNDIVIGDAHKGFGDVYYFTGRYYQALDHYAQAVQLFERANDIIGLKNAIANMAIIYKVQGEYDAALENYFRSQELVWQRKDRNGIAQNYLSIGAVYSQMGEPDSALMYYRRGYHLHSEINFKPGLAMSSANIGNMLVKKDSLEQGIQYLNASQALYRELGDDYNLVMVLGQLANAQLLSGHPYVAERTIEEAYRRSVDLGIPEGIRASTEVYAEIMKSIGAHQKALQFLETSYKIKDSLRNEDLRNDAVRVDLRLEYNKKILEDSIQTAKERFQKELEFQDSLNAEKQKRNILIFLAVGTVLLAIGFYMRTRFVTKSRELLQKEKDRSDELLLNILPYEVAEELKLNGESEARSFDNVTVLFTDFLEFTKTAANLSAKELVNEINVCFKAFDQIIQEHQIEKIKTIGDAYMAAGGLHQPRASEPADVVSAAIKMQQFMIGRRKQRHSHGLPFFDMRVGIHQGPVVAGIVGVKKFQYDIWGDTVNIASRMESHGEIGKVNISETTYQSLKDTPGFTFESRGKIDVKGNGEMGMWYVEPRRKLKYNWPQSSLRTHLVSLSSSQPLHLSNLNTYQL